MKLIRRLSFSFLASAFALCASTSAFASSLTMVSEPGDYIGQGLTYSYTDGISAAASTDLRTVNISVFSGSDWFFVDLAAPLGQQLVPGVYDNAVRYPFQSSAQNGLSVYGNGRGCNTLTGTFTITKATYGAYGYIEELEGEFEQHCEGGIPALFGSFVISNPPPPPAMTFDLQVDTTGTVKRLTGVATVGGTVVCSAATTAQINGTVSQRAGRFNIASGAFNVSVPCGTTPTRWTANVSSYGTPFNQGQAQVDVNGSAYDPNYGGMATDSVSAVVNFTTSKK